MIREPAVADLYYPGNKNQLTELIKRCFTNESIGPGELPNLNEVYERTGEIYGLICPHAGYVYSGPVAAHSYLEQFKDGKPEFFVIIGPNHRNVGPGISVYPEGSWKTPLGEAVIFDEAVEKLVKQPHFRADTTAHIVEHSLEVQVPFLQYLYGPNVPIVPICLKDQSDLAVERVGSTLSKVLANYDYCFIASTDLTHQESVSSAMSKDSYVIECIKKMEPMKLMETVREKYISMCGPAPVASLIIAAKSIGIKEAKIMKYANSGDVTGDKNHVVAYLSAILLK